MQEDPVLQVSNLDVTYDTDSGPLHTVRNVSLSIAEGEIFGLVGESGSGKTTLARAVVRYLPRNGHVRSGSIALNRRDLLAIPESEMRKLWGREIAMVHQNPATAVNPSIRVGEQIAEVGRAQLGLSRPEASARAVEMLDQVRIPDPHDVATRYAHQLSGGMLQRVVIATALMTNPKLLIMDEPTTALDVTTQAVILDLVRDLLRDYRTAVLYITHNLGVVARLADRVGVMYAGELVERGPVREVYKATLHPYTLGLLGCVPSIDADKRQIELQAIPGQIPRPEALPEGCIFAPRCRIARPLCQAERPKLEEVRPGHATACLRWHRVEEELGTYQHHETVFTSLHEAEESLVLEAQDIKKYFPVSGGGLATVLSRQPPMLKAVDGVSVRVRDGFTVGIVGESGCGKTTLARCIAGLEEADAGRLTLEDEEIPRSLKNRPRDLRRKIQMVFQSPESTLNPHHTVGDIIRRPLALLGNLSEEQTARRAVELLQAVKLPGEYERRLPHELSGGEKQRVAIARAFAAQPRLMLCDEPFSSLDVSVQASLMNLLAELQLDRETAYLYVSHDLAAVRYLSDWIAVVYLGQLCEVGSGEDVFSPPSHPYTEALLSSIPIPDPDAKQERIRLGGSIPSAVDVPPGCRFHTRCPRRIGEICDTEAPPWQEPRRHHRIRCHIPPHRLRELQEETLDAITG